MTKHYIRLIHKPKRSHHKKSAPEKARVNLARPPIVTHPGVFHDRFPAFPSALFIEANRMFTAGNPDAARLGLWFLREYRMAHKYWACL